MVSVESVELPYSGYGLYSSYTKTILTSGGTGFLVTEDGYVLTYLGTVEESEIVKITIGEDEYEADVVATDEIGGIQFGDNDNLSAMVANLIDADILVLLTDTEGLYTSNPQLNPDARLISKVSKIDSRIQRLASKTTSAYGVGGMSTKIAAAKLATSSGVTVVIADGRLYIMGYVGEGPDLQEGLACFDAETGEKLWQRLLNDFLSDIIYNRYATANPAIDPETGNVYMQGTQGILAAFTADGQPQVRVFLVAGPVYRKAALKHTEPDTTGDVQLTSKGK